MPIGFLTDAERAQLNRFPDEIPHDDLSAFFTLTDGDIQEIDRQRGDPNRLGFALQLCALRYLGFTPDELGALGLVINVLVLWNTVYMQAALDQLRAESYKVNPDDIARLSPLGYKHFNFLGRYSFNLAEPVANGKLRPLRDPNDLSRLIG